MDIVKLYLFCSNTKDTYEEFELLLDLRKCLTFSLFHSVQPHRPTANLNTSKYAQKYGGAEKCPRCGGPVYAAEKVIGAGKVKGSWNQQRP